MTMTKG